MKAARLLAFALMIIFASSCICVAAEKTAKPQWWGKAPGEKQAVRGTVANVSAQSISVQTEKQGLQTFNITDKTKIMVRGQKAAISNIFNGDPVIVKYKKKQDSVPIAIAIIVLKPSVEGKIVSISGNVITVKNKQNEFKVIVSKETKYVCHDYEVSKNDLKAGARIVAFGSFGSNAFNADLIRLQAERARGAVASIESDMISIKTVKQLIIKGKADQKMKVIISPRVGPDRKGTLADVKVGAPVNIGFLPIGNGIVQLLWIDILTGN